MVTVSWRSRVSQELLKLKRLVPQTAIPQTAVSPSTAAHLSEDLTKVTQSAVLAGGEAERDLQRITKTLIPPGAVAQTGSAFVNVFNDTSVPGGLVVEVNAWGMHFTNRVAPHEVATLKAELEQIAHKMNDLLHRVR